MSQRAIAYVQTLQAYLTETEYAVALALAGVARDEDDAAQVTMTRLATLVERSERWTRKLIRALERYGLLMSHHQQLGVRWTRTTYRFVELEETRPKTRPDLTTVINLATVMQRKAEAMRKQHAQDLDRLRNAYDPILLADVVEALERQQRIHALIEEARDGTVN